MSPHIVARHEENKVVFWGHQLASPKNHAVPVSSLPDLSAILHEARNFFVDLENSGTKDIPITGDLPFQPFSNFGEFKPEHPSDRPGVFGQVGGENGYFSVRKSVPIALILSAYDDVLRECEHAQRSSIKLGVTTKVLPTVVPR